MVVDLKTVMDTVENYIADVTNTFPVHKVYLFGSYAKGTQRWDSDVDLCFFLNLADAALSLDIDVALLGMTRKYDPRICIEPHIFPTSELTNDNPFVKEIIRTGRVLYFPQSF
jgi:predicted nucleotidyltransferase